MMGQFHNWRDLYAYWHTTTNRVIRAQYVTGGATIITYYAVTRTPFVNGYTEEWEPYYNYFINSRFEAMEVFRQIAQPVHT